MGRRPKFQSPLPGLQRETMSLCLTEPGVWKDKIWSGSSDECKICLEQDNAHVQATQQGPGGAWLNSLTLEQRFQQCARHSSTEQAGTPFTTAHHYLQYTGPHFHRPLFLVCALAKMSLQAKAA